MNIKTFICAALLSTQTFAALDGITNDRVEHGKIDDLAAYLENLGGMGRADAYMRLGVLYLRGDGFPVNAARANFYFLKAASLNDPVAHKAIGDSFYSGDGMPKDETLALTHYLKSHDLGYLPGTFNAAVVYKERFDRCHNKADRKAAIRLFQIFMKRSHEKEMCDAAKAMMKALR